MARIKTKRFTTAAYIQLHTLPYVKRLIKTKHIHSVQRPEQQRPSVASKIKSFQRKQHRRHKVKDTTTRHYDKSSISSNNNNNKPDKHYHHSHSNHKLTLNQNIKNIYPGYIVFNRTVPQTTNKKKTIKTTKKRDRKDIEKKTPRNHILCGTFFVDREFLKDFFLYCSSSYIEYLFDFFCVFVFGVLIEYGLLRLLFESIVVLFHWSPCLILFQFVYIRAFVCERQKQKGRVKERQIDRQIRSNLSVGSVEQTR